MLATDKYKGTTAIMVIDEEEHYTAYERIQKRFSEAPIIQGIISSSERLYETSGAKETKRKLDDAAPTHFIFVLKDRPWFYLSKNSFNTRNKTLLIF